jgi:hypothetical protein
VVAQHFDHSSPPCESLTSLSVQGDTHEYGYTASIVYIASLKSPALSRHCLSQLTPIFHITSPAQQTWSIPHSHTHPRTHASLVYLMHDSRMPQR